MKKIRRTKGLFFITFLVLCVLTVLRVRRISSYSALANVASFGNMAVPDSVARFIRPQGGDSPIQSKPFNVNLLLQVTTTERDTLLYGDIKLDSNLDGVKGESPAKSKDFVVPNVVTFVFGLKGARPPFKIENYLAVKSVHENIRPNYIYFYYHWEPVGKWWNLAKPMLTLRRIELPMHIYGNPLDHFAHKADIIRLQALIEHGGIYMDMDVVALRSFDDLRHYDFVMGQEGEG
jgi:hypothetical protein